jgi:2-phosphosulfolactate phosphatase
MPEDTVAAFAQSAYQVRLEWGAAGWARLAPTDLVVVVDVIGERDDPDEPSRQARELGLTGTVVGGGLRNAAAVGRWVLERQSARGERTSVAIIAVGETDADGAPRYAVEDHLGAGAVVAALGDLGIDHCSPEAAVAGEGFRALRGALRHLLTASGSGRLLGDTAGREAVLAAAAVDAASEVRVLA